MDGDLLVEAEATVQPELSFSVVMTEKISQGKQCLSDMEENYLLDEEYWPEYFRLSEKLSDCLDILDQHSNFDVQEDQQEVRRNNNEETTALKYVNYCNKLIVQLYNVQRNCVEAYAKTLGYQHHNKKYLQSSEDDIAVDDYDYQQNPYYRSSSKKDVGPFSSSAIQGWSEKGGYHRDGRICNGKYEFDEMKYVTTLASINQRVMNLMKSLRQQYGLEIEKVNTESQREDDVQVSIQYNTPLSHSSNSSK